jgi:ribonuclease PH
MTENGGLIEIQGTAEQNPFTKKQLDEMVEMASKGIKEIIKIQKLCLS